ncbi:MAG: hypothetical protein JXA36_05775 [Coriobacteriia bacterium]|nr:hypothetical protein [Coriobacteriia bacterium]
MTDIDAKNDEVAKSRKGVIRALLALGLVVVLGGGYLAVGGADGVVRLLSGESDTPAEDVQPSAPETPAAEEPVAEEPAAEEPAAEETATAETPAVSDTSGTSNTSAVTPSPAPEATPPTADQQNRMYWEQIWSQEQIGNLVRGEIASFTLGTVTRSGSTANVRVTANYKSGSAVSGTMVLRDYSGIWYFSSITRDGHAAITPMGTGDTSVIAAIVSQQAANQEIPTGIISGGYKKVTVNSVSQGSGTATLNITLSGGTAAPMPGTITCVSKTIGGVKHWFITSFAK